RHIAFDCTLEDGRRHQRRDRRQARLPGADGGAQVADDSQPLGESPMKLVRTVDLNWPPLPDHLDQICDRFEAAWKAARAGEPRPRLEDFLAGVPEPECPPLLRELWWLEVDYRGQFGET